MNVNYIFIFVSRHVTLSGIYCYLPLLLILYFPGERTNTFIPKALGHLSSALIGLLWFPIVAQRSW